VKIYPVPLVIGTTAVGALAFDSWLVGYAVGVTIVVLVQRLALRGFATACSRLWRELTPDQRKDLQRGGSIRVP
jgi:hypothetical protein